jgi:hypothetical protein
MGFAAAAPDKKAFQDMQHFCYLGTKQFIN